MQLAQTRGIFGGTFDPIHNGHIYPVMEAAKQVDINTIALMPNYQPAHKLSTQSDTRHRLAMIRLVCEEFPIFYPELWEIEQASVSYSVETLKALRKQYPTSPLCFFIGTDSLYSLPTWHCWHELLDLCHFVVCQRKNETLTSARTPSKIVEDFLKKHEVKDAKILHQTLAGHIYLASTSEIPISSSQIRQRLAEGKNVEHLLPSTIYDYIERFKLYQN